MRRWDFAVALDQKRELPVFLQLASAIADGIRVGRLKPGDTLPGTRELAGSLGVNRNTVVAGYEELLAEGLVQTRVGGGTYVAGPIVRPPRSGVAPQTDADAPTFELDEPSCPAPIGLNAPPGMLMLSLGLPDARLFPSRALARAFRRAIGQRHRTSLSYADPSGHVRLRTQLAAMLSRTRGLPVSADNLMVTRSIEQAIDLVARLLLRPGDAVAVEAFGFPPAWSVLRLAGARLVPVPIDRHGFDVAAFEQLLARERFRAVFLTPHHQFPTGSVMSAARRARLAELAVAHEFAILEDDYDHEFHYAGKPILPIAAGPGSGNVIYMGSLSNLLSPGVTSAFVTARPEVFQPLLRLRAASDSRGDAAMECAVAELFEDGELLRHMRRVRRTYLARRDALASALSHHLQGALEFQVPEGGTAIWTRAAPDIDVPGWAEAGRREGVLFADSRRYDFHGCDASHVRLGFSYHDENELVEAVRRMARALMRVRAPRLHERGEARRLRPDRAGGPALPHEPRAATARRSS